MAQFPFSLGRGSHLQVHQKWAPTFFDVPKKRLYKLVPVIPIKLVRKSNNVHCLVHEAWRIVIVCLYYSREKILNETYQGADPSFCFFIVRIPFSTLPWGAEQLFPFMMRTDNKSIKKLIRVYEITFSNME